MTIYFIYCLLAPWIVLRDPGAYETDETLFVVQRGELASEVALFETFDDARAWIDVIDEAVHRRGKVQLLVGKAQIFEVHKT